MIVGLAGHVDHGKTALVRALTGVDTDRLPEEKARGITIDLGFAYLRRPDGETIGFVDVPGHERFVGTMAAGAAGIDLLLLVVAADDGVMPQTREHLAIADLLGVRRGLVALSKADLVAPERRAAVSAEIAAALAPGALRGSPIVPVSTLTGEGLDAFRSVLEAHAGHGFARNAGRRFRLSVDRSFSLAGAGTIVTGTVLSGEVAVGQRVTISPGGISARVRSIHAANRPAERGRAGERCALNLAGVDRDAVSRGDVALDPSLHAPTERVDALVRILGSEARPVGSWLPVRLHHGAAEVADARLVPLSSDTIAPGTEGFAQLVLGRPIAAAVGDAFVLRDTSARRTIGGGVFVDLRAPARKRRSPERLAALEAGRDPYAERALERLLERSPFILDLTAFGRDRALDPSAVERLGADAGIVRLRTGEATFAVAAARWRAFSRALGEALLAFHVENPDLQGIGSERLRLGLVPRLPRPVFTAALGGLASSGSLALDGSWVRLPGHVARMGADDEALWAKIEPLVSGAERFRPPRVRDIAGVLGAPEPGIRRLFKLAGRMGRVDEVAHDHFFSRGAVAEMAGIVRRLSDAAPERAFTAARFRDTVDTGRKVAIQILDFFDRHGVTMRRGDLRRANPHRADLFGEVPRARPDG